MISIEPTDLELLIHFLKVSTPTEWLKVAKNNLELLLIDHAHCERKASATAINFISKYPEKKELIKCMSPLAREELLHFEKVIEILDKKQITFVPLTPSNYAIKLHGFITKAPGNQRLVDQLIVGAIIEARSCERFSALINILEDNDLARFYSSLVKSEARHFRDYLHLAELYGDRIEERVQFFLAIENNYILAKDDVFRFHSGIPE
ncbi:MAG: tRNA-(ms[2]io[6]A)-hydroxylase [Proteobacteria bacterium]|nr:tRNA-(ms[2]io[6]A)-hydroxylase [Pseudomonadota bacterium]